MFRKSKSHLLTAFHVVSTSRDNHLQRELGNFTMRCSILRQSGEKIYATCIIKVISDQLDLKEINALDNKPKYKTTFVV